MTTSVRPVTGKLLVGGDAKQCSVVEHQGAWLKSKEPTKFLYDYNALEKAGWGLVRSFIVPATQDSTLTHLLFDVPLIFGQVTGYVTPIHDLRVLYLEEGCPWQEAVTVATLSLYSDLAVIEERQGAQERIARSWDKAWFLSKLVEGLETSYVSLREEYQATKSDTRGRELALELVENKLVTSLIKCLI